MKEKTIKERESILTEKEKLLNSTIQTLQSDVSAKDKILLQTKNIVDTLQTQLAYKREGNSGFIIIALIIALVIGIIIGVLMKK